MLKIKHLTESLEEKLLTERRNQENEEINALLRKYVAKKNIPEKAKRAIEAAGIEVHQDEDGIFFKGPNGKVLSGDGRTYRHGPHAPQSRHERGQFKNWGSEGSRGWDLSQSSAGSYNDITRRAQMRKSWEDADLKGYLDSDRKLDPYKSRHERKAMVDPSYSPEASEYEEGDPTLRPHSDKYRHLKAKSDEAEKSRGWGREYYGIKSDEDIEAEVQKFRDELIKKNNYNKERNQEYEDKADAAKAEVDQYLKDKGVR